MTPYPKMRLWRVKVTYEIDVPAQSRDEARAKSTTPVTMFDAGEDLGQHVVSWDPGAAKVVGTAEDALPLAMVENREYGDWPKLKAWIPKHARHLLSEYEIARLEEDDEALNDDDPAG